VAWVILELSCLFGILRPTLIAWIKKAKSLPELKENLAAAHQEGVLELEEMWSYVGKKGRSIWL